MRSVNKVIVMGYLAADPEIRETAAGHKVANFKVATNYEWTDGEGEKKQITDFHKVTAWRKLGEIVGKHLTKGSGVYLEGKLVNRSYKDKEGVKKDYTEIMADSINFISYKKNTDSEELNLVEVPA
jgi:single-strand DNA-binding protein